MASYIMNNTQKYITKREVLHTRREFANMRELVEYAAQTYGDKPAYSFKIKPSDKEKVFVSFKEHAEDIRALTTEFIKRGYTGKHCVVSGKNSYEWILCYYSLFIAGAVMVPLDRDWLAADLADTAKRAECDLLICDGDMTEKAQAIADATGITDVYHLAREGENSIGELVKAGKAAYAENPSLYAEIEQNPDIMQLLVFTSGTTGKGKGVMLTQHNVLSDMAELIPYIDFGPKTVGVLPLHHTFGSSVMLVGHMSIGTEHYISSGLRYIQKEMKEEKPTNMILVPLYLETFYRKIQANIKAQNKEKLVARMIKLTTALRKVGIDLRKKVFKSIREAFGGELKIVICGGAPLNADIVKFFEAIGINTLNGYGITECAPIISVNHSRHNIIGSIGFLSGIDELKFSDVNEDGEGEICVRGSNVMLGYYNDEAATADAFDEEGFFKTGDYGRLGKHNTLFITGRKKNLIILSNGKNVYPEEIENELMTTPGILEIVVYEGKSKRGSEHDAIVAEIYPDADFVKKEGIEDFKSYVQPFVDAYNKGAVHYKKIAVVKIRDEEFPKTSTRKIQRFKIDTSID